MIDTRAVFVSLSLATMLTAGPAIAQTPDSVSSEHASAPPASSRPRVLAVARLVLPRDLEDPEPIRARFETMMTDQLRSAGFEVIPPDRFEALQASVRDSMGGYFNAETGEIDSTRFEAVNQAVRQAARQRLGAEGIVKSGVGVFPVAFRGGPKVRWDGAEDNARARGSGTLPVYSLLVHVSGTDGREIHHGAGGIQLAKKFGRKSLLSNDLVLKEVERKDLFADDEKNLHAVRMALTPFAAHEKGKD